METIVEPCNGISDPCFSYIDLESVLVWVGKQQRTAVRTHRLAYRYSGQMLDKFQDSI